MSIIIKDMKMPPSCYFCSFADTSFIRCEAFSPTKLLEDDCEERRPKWCPLIELPPHGRLIDADALLDESEWYGERATYDNPMPDGEEVVSIESILNTPTIFEEEEK